MKKKELATVIVGIAILAAVIAIARLYHPKLKLPALNVQNVPLYSFPNKFPVSVPVEEGAIVVSNYNATSPDGKIQATRTFESKKSVDENFGFYKKFIADRNSGWVFLNEVNNGNQPGHKALFAKSGFGTLSVNISARGAPAASLVEISFLAAAQAAPPVFGAGK